MPSKQSDVALEQIRAKREIAIAIISAISGVIIALIGTGIFAAKDLQSGTLTAPSTVEAQVITVTQVVEASPTPVVQDILSIEALPFFAFAYEGSGNPEVGQGWGRLSVEHDDNARTGYKLDYSLPNDGYGYAGLAFQFREAQDLTEYDAVGMTISFWDEQARCELVIKDITGQGNYVLLGVSVPPPPGSTVTVNGSEHAIIVPFDPNFDLVNRKVIKEIGFFCDTDFSRGGHSLTARGIQFLKR